MWEGSIVISVQQQFPSARIPIIQVKKMIMGGEVCDGEGADGWEGIGRLGLGDTGGHGQMILQRWKGNISTSIPSFIEKKL